VLLLIIHSLQIVQILDAVLYLVKSLNFVVMKVCQHLLRCLLLHFLWDCCHLYFHSCFAMRLPGPLPLIFITRRKTEINDSINDSVLSRLGLKLPINDSNNVFGFESLSMSCLCTRGYFSSKGWLGSLSAALIVWTVTWPRQSCPYPLTWRLKKMVGPEGD
jgi:hypothetical protein